MTTDTAIELRNDIEPTALVAETFTIESRKDVEEASEMLTLFNKKFDEVQREKEKVTKPLNLALRQERARWQPIESRLKSAIEILRAKIGAYQTTMLRKAEEERKKIAARVGTGKGKIKMETAANKINALEVPEEEVLSESGTVKFRTKQELVIDDATALPRKYLVPDEKKIMDDLKKGVVVRGAHIEEKQIPVNYR